MDYGKSTQITHQRITMLDFMHEIKEFDFISFLPHEDNDNALAIVSQEYKDESKGEPVDETSVGPSYHIVLFKWDEEKPTHIDSFEAVFSDIREYISNLIPQDWYGIAVRKTTKSGPIFQKILDNLNKV